ncbi:hypothetical protein [Pseudidiomarina sp.]|uniref:hypothetical protein n=1 Tax=Pseudidiomarina sp. TaxID=2081707 RepID=UPI003A976321
MAKRRGFILMELVIALSLLSALLLFSQRWVTQQALGSRVAANLPAAQQMLTAIELFWLHERRAPTALSELVTKGYIAEVWQPWAGQWQLLRQENMLRLTLPATDLGLAQRTSEQLPGAHVNADDELALHVFEPIQLALYQRYLHRVADTSAPEYNQMEADLDMRGHTVRNVDGVDAQTVVATRAVLDAATFGNVRATTLAVEDLVADQASLGGHDVVALAQRLEQLQTQWNQCRSNGGCQ